jgi:hypothetical protein
LLNHNRDQKPHENEEAEKWIENASKEIPPFSEVAFANREEIDNEDKQHSEYRGLEQSVQ